MILERVLHTDLRALLMSDRPFQYAHLIKFERPSRPDELSGRISTSAQRYTYMTDGSKPVTFDDGSVNLQGTANGPQLYVANKVLGIGAIQESSVARADTCSLTLDGNGIGALVSGSVVITVVDASTWDLQWPVELIHYGFREGDKVTLTGDRTGSFNIFKFRANNTIRIKKIDDNLTAGTVNLTMALSSEEIKSVLLNKNDANYASFINREVYIYRAYFENGSLVGATPDVNGIRGPVLLFRGIINNVSFEDTESGITVQWGLTSHWGDFSQVRGRITSDEFHRALDQNGIPQPDSAIKQIYAYDKGFAHSETSINLLSNYTVLVDKITVKTKKGFFGIGAKTKVKTVAVPENRATPLDFQLQAKSIPVIYGVRNTTGIPIFADTLKSNSSEVYVVYALSEGQIGGIYDVYLDGKSLICNNKEDSDARSVQTAEGNVELICRGRADRGDVLGGTTSIGSTVTNYYDSAEGRTMWNLLFNRNSVMNYNNYVGPTAVTSVSNTGAGVIHGETISLVSPQTITLDFFSGTESQKAASQLVEIAKAKNFKVQNDYWTGTDTAEYWGPNHRLIDTAYVVGKFIIKEGETTIPEIEFITRGKVVDCYNYDYSYAHDEKMIDESESNFLLGDMVTLSTGQSVQIIDKWSFVRPDGLKETRFRFSEVPNLGYNADGVPTTKRFTMTKGSFVWTMTTYDWVVHSGTVPQRLSANITTPVAPPDTPTVGGRPRPPTLVGPGTNGGVTVTFDTSTLLSVGGDPSTAKMGEVFQAAGAQSIYTRNVLPATTDKVYEVSADFELISQDPAETTTRVRVGMRSLLANYSGTGSVIAGPSQLISAGQKITITSRFSSSAGTDITAWSDPTNAVWVRPLAQFYNATNSVIRVTRVTVRDVTTNEMAPPLFVQTFIGGGYYFTQTSTGAPSSITVIPDSRIISDLVPIFSIADPTYEDVLLVGTVTGNNTLTTETF